MVLHVSIISKRQICFALILLKSRIFSIPYFLFWKRLLCPGYPFPSHLAMHSCLPHVHSVSLWFCLPLYFFSSYSHFQAKQHNFLFVLCKSYYINSLTPSKDSEYFCYLLLLIWSVLHSSRSLSSASLFTGCLFSIHFQHFFLDLESSFGSFCSSNNADHTGSTQMTNSCISLAVEASWVAEHSRAVWRCRSARRWEPSRDTNAALPSRGLFSVMEPNIKHCVTRTFGGLASFAVICYESKCEGLCVCNISSDMSGNAGKNGWQQLCVLLRHRARVAAPVWDVLENTIIV